MNFSKFNVEVQNQFAAMIKTESLFCTDVPGDELWELYLKSFPEGSNNIFRERRHHDCSCCRSFIRNIGNVVAFDTHGKIMTIWDREVKNEPEYSIVSAALSEKVRNAKIVDTFLHYEKNIGTAKTYEQITGSSSVKTWEHFHVTLPTRFVKDKNSIPTLLNDVRTRCDVFSRGLELISIDVLDTILDLINQNTLYRGEEHKNLVVQFRKQKIAYDKLSAEDKKNFAWINVNDFSAKFKNTVIGTLAEDLSNGDELDKAVRSFESKVAPANYQRPKSLVTQKMVDVAKEELIKLNLLTALERRHANLDDIKVTDIIWINRETKSVIEKDDIFDDIKKSAKPTFKTDKLEEIAIDKFIANVLPNVTNVDVMVENSHVGNFVSLITVVDPTAEQLFKWNNPFSWSYKGEVASSIKERVKSAGGNVTADVCCRLSWFNYDDLDLHMLEPDGTHIYYSSKRSTTTGGCLDIDMNAGGGNTREAVENIYYSDHRKMKPGKYKLFVNQFCVRETKDIGFDVEIDIMGETYSFSYRNSMRNSENVEVAVIDVAKDGTITVTGSVKPIKISKEFWNVHTNQFTKVNVVTYSPNYWGDNAVGNKHYFFMLENCKNDEDARGFYNEFLKNELNVHRKTMEIVGSKTKVKETPNQLSGIGFSSTERNSLIVRISGSFTRTLKVLF